MRTWKRSCILVASFFTFPLHAALTTSEVCSQKHCEIVIDAGSSGTRFYLYALDAKKFSDNYDLILLDKKLIDKPLSDYHDEKIFTLFDELLQDYKSHPIQVYMYATEGLRSLNLSEQRKRFSLAKKWFDTQSKLNLKELRTLGGEEEGVLLWVANAVELLKNKHYEAIEQSGIIEIGGGSAQIAFSIKQNNLESNQHVHSIHFMGQTFNIWSISFPNLGIVNMKESYQDNESCYPKNYPMSDHQYGKGNITACISGIKEYKQTHGISSTDAVVKSRNLLQKEFNSHQWYGFGVPDYMGKSEVLDFAHSYYSLLELKSRADETSCKSDWKTQEKQYPSVKFKERVCFSSAYVYWFAEDLLNLPLSTNINYHENDVNLGWSKGNLIIRHTTS